MSSAPSPRTARLPASPRTDPGGGQQPVPVSIRRVGEGAIHDLPGLLTRLYANRGAATAAGSGLADLLAYDRLAGWEQAADLLAWHITNGKRMLIVGDYDADGATGAAVGVLGLQALGATPVDFLTPSRFTDGYGLSAGVVEAAAARGPQLLITVDNGIASIDGVARANALGLPVIVTDHHLPGAGLPAAAAIVNPNQPGCGFPSKHLAGVGVLFYLLIATRARLRAQGWFNDARPAPNLADLLDLVALGTVADVVTLDANNRILVEQGLRRIRAGRCRPGLRALLEIAGRRVAQVTARDLGFDAGPRLNAAGRIDDMGIGIACLLADNPVEAMQLARRLNALNHERRDLTAGMRDEAEAICAGLAIGATGLPAGLCLYGEDWHQGVVGIVAARIREHWQRPVIAFADGGDGRLRGSARSVDGLHLRDCIDLVDKRHPGLIERFGGHAMAAGVTLPRANLEGFAAAFDQAVTDALGTDPPVRELLSDGELPAGLLTLHTADAVRTAAPWGKGFTEPLFDGHFAVESARIVAERHLRLRVTAPGGPPLEAIGFNLASQRAGLGRSARLVYRLDVNEYRGLRTPQLLLEHVEPALP